MHQNLLTVNDLAERLRVPKSWVYSRTRRVGRDSIPKLRVGKYLRFDLNQVVEWLQKQTYEE